MVQSRQDLIHADVHYVLEPEGGLVVIEGEGEPQRNFDHEVRKTPVTNARLAAATPSLDGAGFTLVERSSSFQDFEDAARIEAEYYMEIEQLVKDVTGAARALAFDHNVRVDSGTRQTTYRGQKPVRSVHNDYTDVSAPKRVNDFLSVAGAAAHPDARVAFINAWRPLNGPIHDAHLAVCDARTVPCESLLRAELRYPDRVGEIYYGAFHPAHRWYYFPRMVPSEVLLLKVYDSAVDGRARFTPHTAIDDPTAPANAPARESVEVRTIVFFE